MPTTRVFTDVPPEQVAFVLQLIAFDGGTATQQPEPDGQVTIVATFPDPPDARVARAAAQTPEAAWMKVARAELGVAEDPSGSHPRIEAYHASTNGGAADDAVPWCSSFVNFCVEAAGQAGTRSKAARSWMDWGRDAGDFVPGCIVVLKRGSAPKGHVGFFAGFEAGRIKLLGGNQGDRVSVASFDVDRVLARRLAPAGDTA
jgi:uncharacterized protein (TIGR02594 family)